MLTYPSIDPVAFHLGPWPVHWYGIMYLIGFLGVFLLGRYRIRTQPNAGMTNQDLDDLIFYAILGTVIGGRLGYVLFYKPDYYFSYPLEIFAIGKGGMSFHGGFLGVIFAAWLFAYRRKKSWLQVTDFAAPLVPPALGFGRIGNFINGELWGRTTDVPWAMVFSHVDAQPRHPSQIYQIVLEGIVLFAILWIYSRKPRPYGAVSGLFLVGYGVLRFIVEFTREPDDFLGLLAGNLSMGQWLSLPMIVIGVAMIIWANRRHPSTQSIEKR